MNDKEQMIDVRVAMMSQPVSMRLAHVLLDPSYSRIKFNYADNMSKVLDAAIAIDLELKRGI